MRARFDQGVVAPWCLFLLACGGSGAGDGGASGAGPASGGAAMNGGTSSATRGGNAGSGRGGSNSGGGSAGGGTPAASAVGAPTQPVTPGGWKCPAGASGTPTLTNVTPTRVAGVPPSDGFSPAESFNGNLEGPVWLGDALYLSELSGDAYDDTNRQVAKSRILKIGIDDSVSVAIADSGSNGLALDGAGAIVAAVHKDGTLTRFVLPGGAASYVATGYMGFRFDAPNDLVLRSDGNIYFSDPNYQAPLNLPQTATRVYRVTPAGEVLALEDTFMNPNGVTLSLDESWLYVAARGGRRYALASDGSVGAGEDFAPMSGVDGVTLDCAGNLYVARGRDVVVYDAAANQLGSIRVPDVSSVTNVAFGGSDRKTLYITGLGPRRGLFKVPLNIAGRPY